MRSLWGLGISLILLAQTAAAQSLADLARKERERKAQQEKPGVTVTTDDMRRGELDLSPRLDPARKSDLEYLLQQLSHPKASPELLAAFVPLKDQAVPKLLPMLTSADLLKRVAPATVLMVLGNTEGLGAMASLLVEATGKAAAPEPKGVEQPSEETLRQRLEAAREADYALVATKLGVWRFTEGSTLTAEQVVEQLRSGLAIEVVGGVDNGQRLFNRALRASDANLRRGADALMRVAAGGKDFGYQPDQPADKNEAAIQGITTFLATERAKVVAAIGAKPR